MLAEGSEPRWEKGLLWRWNRNQGRSRFLASVPLQRLAEGKCEIDSGRGVQRKKAALADE